MVSTGRALTVPGAVPVSRRAVVAATALLFAAIAVADALLVPMGENADEAFHTNYVRMVEQHLALPGAGVVEKQQPPLYYLLAASVLKLTGNLHAVRLLSVALGVLTLLLVFAVARELAPRHRWVPVIAMALVAALPTMQSVSAAISDDALAWAAGAAVIWCTVRLARTPQPSTRLLVATGAACGVALLAKETAWPLLIPLAAVAVWRLRGAASLRSVAALLLPALLIAGWWFGRNAGEFHALTPPLAPLNHSHPELRSLASLRAFASSAVRTLFGPERPDGGALPRSLPVRALEGVLGAALLAGLGVVAWDLWRLRVSQSRHRAAVIAVAAGFGLVLLAWLLNSVLVDLQPQPRYLLVAVAGPATALAWLIAQSWRAAPAWRQWLIAAVIVLPLGVLDLDGLRAAILRQP